MDIYWSFMKIARKKRFIDVSLFLFLLVLIISGLYLNLYYILPYMYRQPSPVWWIIMYVLPLTFIIFNLMTNFIAVICADSSILGRSLPSPTLTENSITYCHICHCDMPPRCWHCDACNVCILTRDHHCAVCMTCVGHYNRRYYLWFLLYMAVAGFYEMIPIGYYTYNEVTIRLPDLIVIFWPIPAFITGFHLNKAQICIALLTINFTGVIISSLLFVFHINKVCKGLVCHEKQVKNYDFGLMRNLETVFGEKWYITWISPFIKSKLPYDGFDWQSDINNYCKID